MGDWLSENGWALWMVAAVLLGITELLSLDLFLIMLAAGALAGGLTAVVAPDLWWLQALVAASVSGLSLGLLRPTLLARVRSMPGYRSSVSTLVGRPGRVTVAVADGLGEVKVDGQTWSARPYDETMELDVGTEIEVFELDGTVVVVYPRHLGLEGS
ncbi:NfeD family protein [Auraticoccus monumenti]|uniref:Membrane protein implicated in regulation of membrane protease activity n=1 Tax=Auraticoccus monumenti TaxID=675864 RepID=A0A1G6TY66_9ACTN|nr:NfeD family protein [Auraticoccus monumenti]SDD33307.1 Membrane protein implicated in regulation of membrane protease activity [Auraticoccus monumenti]